MVDEEEGSPGRMPEAEALPGSTAKELGSQPSTVNEARGSGDRFTGLEASLSLERFETYLAACDGDRELALKAYAHNTAISAALYSSFQHLEIALRNSFHRQLSLRYGEWWFDELGVITDVFQRQKLSEAQVELVKSGKPLTAGRVVASLSFGFWTGCLTSRYEDTLWRRGGLSATFMASGQKPKRSAVNRMLTPIRILRNRVAHHEPVLKFDLPRRHMETLLLTRMLSPQLADWSEAHSRFQATYDPALALHFRGKDHERAETDSAG